MGWATAEHGMLLKATHTHGKQSGRSQEIRRLIGRACAEPPRISHKYFRDRCRGGFLTAFGTSRDCSAAANKYLHTMED
jgi:hypothetical protein